MNPGGSQQDAQFTSITEVLAARIDHVNIVVASCCREYTQCTAGTTGKVEDVKNTVESSKRTAESSSNKSIPNRSRRTQAKLWVTRFARMHLHRSHTQEDARRAWTTSPLTRRFEVISETTSTPEPHADRWRQDGNGGLDAAGQESGHRTS